MVGPSLPPRQVEDRLQTQDVKTFEELILEVVRDGQPWEPELEKFIQENSSQEICETKIPESSEISEMETDSSETETQKFSSPSKKHKNTTDQNDTFIPKRRKLMPQDQSVDSVMTDFFGL